MNVLVTGGYGFIGSFVAEKFYKEGHKVFILDNLSTGNKENITFHHPFSTLNVENEACEELFRLNKFDIVIHLAAQVDVRTSLDNPVLDTKTNMLGLSNMLHLSQKYGVQKFVFASSAAVYGKNTEVPLKEETILDPISPYGLNKWLGEKYCQKWNELYNLQTLCFRFSNVYGPRQNASGEGGVISIYINNLIKNKPLTIFGDGTQTRDFIYVEDIVEAIYRSVLSDLSGVFNLSNKDEVSINELIDTLGEITDLTKIVHNDWRPGDIYRSSLDHTQIIEQLDWVSKYSLKEGLKKTYQWFSNNMVESPPENSKYPFLNDIFVKIKAYASYLENVFLFILTIALELLSQQAFESVDFKILYILITGIWLGKNQSIIASGLTIILYTYEKLVIGREFFSLLMDNETLLNFAIYIFIGIVSGYVIDKKNAREISTRLELEALQSKHSFLTELYQETRQIKDDLQIQILNSEDSIGKIYSIVQRLDRLEPEYIFAEAISVLEQTLKTKSVAIYVNFQNQQFLRLVSKSNNPHLSIPRSVRMADNKEMDQVIKTGNMFINKKLKQDCPLVMAPLKDKNMVGIICVYDTDFDQLTLNYQNLLKVVVNLITASFSRAYKHMQATTQERYIEGTPILKPSYFKSLIDQKNNLMEQLGIEFSLIEIDKDLHLTRYTNLLENSLRERDYIGMDELGKVKIILSNTNDQEAEIVLKRLIRLGIPAKKLQRELSYG